MEIPEWIDKPAWEGFVEMRKRIKKPLTDRAITIAIHKLEMLLQAGNDPTAVLDQSTFNSYQGLWPVHGSDGNERRENGGGTRQYKSSGERKTDIAREARSASLRKLGLRGNGTGCAPNLLDRSRYAPGPASPNDMAREMDNPIVYDPQMETRKDG